MRGPGLGGEQGAWSRQQLEVIMDAAQAVRADAAATRRRLRLSRDVAAAQLRQQLDESQIRCEMTRSLLLTMDATRTAGDYAP